MIPAAYNYRIKNGMSMAEALAAGRHPDTTDHLGNKFKSIADMCRTWDVNLNVYLRRIKRGMSVAEALTAGRRADTITDHTGNIFKSIADMCCYWCINKVTFSARSKKCTSWTFKDTLTRLPNDTKIDDHLTVPSLPPPAGV